MQYVKTTMSLSDRAKMECLESKTAQQEQEISDLKSNNDLLTQCVLEMSEQLYQ